MIQRYGEPGVYILLCITVTLDITGQTKVCGDFKDSGKPELLTVKQYFVDGLHAILNISWCTLIHNLFPLLACVLLPINNSVQISISVFWVCTTCVLICTMHALSTLDWLADQQFVQPEQVQSVKHTAINPDPCYYRLFPNIFIHDENYRENLSDLV